MLLSHPYVQPAETSSAALAFWRKLWARNQEEDLRHTYILYLRCLLLLPVLSVIDWRPTVVFAFYTSTYGSIMQQCRKALIPTADSKRCKMKKPESSNWRWTRGSLPQPAGLDLWLSRPNLCWIPPWTLTCLLGHFWGLFEQESRLPRFPKSCCSCFFIRTHQWDPYFLGKRSYPGCRDFVKSQRFFFSSSFVISLLCNYL